MDQYLEAATDLELIGNVMTILSNTFDYMIENHRDEDSRDVCIIIQYIVTLTQLYNSF
jgi:hypothetical protein